MEMYRKSYFESHLVGKGALDAILSQINKKIGDRFHFQWHRRRLNYQFLNCVTDKVNGSHVQPSLFGEDQRPDPGNGGNRAYLLSSFYSWFLNINKTLWERIFGRGRNMGTILWTCVIAAKQLSSYLTREDKSFTLLVCWTTHLIQYVPIHNNNPVISWQCLKIFTSSLPTYLEPNCYIGHKWLQPGE